MHKRTLTLTVIICGLAAFSLLFQTFAQNPSPTREKQHKPDLPLGEETKEEAIQRGISEKLEAYEHADSQAKEVERERGNGVTQKTIDKIIERAKQRFNEAVDAINQWIKDSKKPGDASKLLRERAKWNRDDAKNWRERAEKSKAGEKEICERAATDDENRAQEYEKMATEIDEKNALPSR
jgi:hypothetical protein